MLRTSLALLSSSFQPSAAFVKSAAELVKLHYAHRAAIEEKDHKVANKIEDVFQNELYDFRPLFTVAESVRVGRAYTKQVYSALRYFGLNEDPLARQLEAILGKTPRKQGSKLAVFRGISPETRIRPKTAAGANNSSAQLSKLREAVIDYKAEERPLPAESVYSIVGPSNQGRRQPAGNPDMHRGHWVLQDPDLQGERRTDPW